VIGIITSLQQLHPSRDRRVTKEKRSSQASVAELRKIVEYLQKQIAEGKGKEADINDEIKKIETYLDEDQIKGKKFQQDLEDIGQKNL